MWAFGTDPDSCDAPDAPDFVALWRLRNAWTRFLRHRMTRKDTNAAATRPPITIPAIAPPLSPSELVSEEGDPTLSPSSAVEVGASEDEVVVTWRARQL